MRNLIILLLIIINPVLISDTPEITFVNHKTRSLQASESFPRLVDNSTTISWIKSHQKKDGGYGRLDNFWSHGSWTYAAVHALSLLNKTRRDSLAVPEDIYNTAMYIQSLEFGNGYRLPPYRTNRFAFEDIYALNLLFYEPFNKYSVLYELSQINLTQSAVWQASWREESFSQIEEIYYTVTTLKLLNATDRANRGDVIGLVNWVKAFQNPDGGWDNIRPDNDPYNLDGTSYVTYTLYAVMTLSNLKVAIPNNNTLIKFIQSCQNPDGGFGNRPDGLGSVSDVYYTFAAIQTLKIFNEEPVDAKGAIQWLNRLQNYDGGFGDKPQWNSRLYSTYYAIHSLIMLNGTIFEKIRNPPTLNPIPTTHHVFSYGMEVQPYNWFPSESVLIADDLGLDLFGLKTADVSQSIQANNFAEYYNYSTRTVLNPEFYTEKVLVKGLGRFTHVADVLFPPESDTRNIGGEFEWHEFKNRIKKGHEGGALFWKISYTKDFDYLVIDDSIERLDGYDLIDGGSIYFGEAIRIFPWFERWIGKIPMVANTDAHHEFWILRKQFETIRTLFIASNSSWNGFKEAALNNRIVVAYKTADSPGFDDVVLYGSSEAISYLYEHSNEWVWWKSDHSISEIVITPITHGSSVVPDNSNEWDLGNFTKAILRIKNNTQLVSLKLDGQQLNNLTFVDRTDDSTLISFFYVHLEKISNGTHIVEAEYLSQNNLPRIKTIIFDMGYPSLYLHDLKHFPTEPTNKESVMIKVTVIDRVPIKRVVLWYSTDEKTTWNAIDMSKNSNSVYSASISTRLSDSTIYYYVEAFDEFSDSVRFPSNEKDYLNFIISHKKTPKEYAYIFTFSVIPIVSIVSLLAEFHWNRKARKHS